MKASEIRSAFLEFFSKRGHVILPSAPVVPHDDPTLLFVNAGMNQFKDVFLGSGTRPFNRAANVQKCIRAGGKHNDLDDVGTDTYHHTYFEMLGSWSFGDYFKADAIPWAWQLLTEVYGIPKERLHTTYFAGDPQEGLAADEEARKLWCELTDINPQNVHPGSKKDNFWEMGESGPCGPCSEIHVDLTPDLSGRALVNKSSPLVLELWNLVFIQFNRDLKGKLSPLPARHIDTGMGFERLVTILQKKQSSYDTDLLQPIIQHLEEVTGAGAYTRTTPSARPTPAELRDVAYRVLADHLRCLTIAITDGALPSNEGRGYVIRRILRRACTYARRQLNVTEPFLHQQVPFVVGLMGDNYPELKTNCSRVAEIVRGEEEAFLATLEHGLKLFAVAAGRATSQGGKLSGEDTFKLHDTYGFPVDLTKLMAQEQGLSVDVEGYSALMEAARERARTGGTPVEVDPKAALLQAAQAALPSAPRRPAATDDSPKWAGTECRGRVQGWVDGAGRLQASPLATGDTSAVVLAATCFYAEQGGQVGDTGVITTASGRFRVETTQKASGVVLHIGRLEDGRIEVGQEADCAVDVERRTRTCANHTCTHLLNWALREVLGEHVQQRGSIVDPERLRFDFSHQGAMEPVQLSRAESLVKVLIDNNLKVHAGLVDRDKALGIAGIRAVFEDQYADTVRVVSIGVSEPQVLADPANEAWHNFSIELCGGTHLAQTGEAREFVLLSEEGIGRGVRRLHGLSGGEAAAARGAGAQLLAEAASIAAAPHEEDAFEAWKSRVDELARRIDQARLSVGHQAELSRQIGQFREIIATHTKQQRKQASSTALDAAAAMLDSAPVVNGITVVVGNVPDCGAEQLRNAIDWIRRKSPTSAAVLISSDGGKVVILAGMTKDVVDRGIRANELVSLLSRELGGGGGGRPDLAQGGGVRVDGVSAALKKASDWISERAAK